MHKYQLNLITLYTVHNVTEQNQLKKRTTDHKITLIIEK